MTTRWTAALSVLVVSGVGVGTLVLPRLLRHSPDPSSTVSLPIVGQQDAPYHPSLEDFPRDAMLENRNSEPIELGSLASGEQGPLVPQSRTADQIRLDANIIRDFGQMLDCEFRSPQSERIQRSRDQMLDMLQLRPNVEQVNASP